MAYLCGLGFLTAWYLSFEKECGEIKTEAASFLLTYLETTLCYFAVIC